MVDPIKPSICQIHKDATNIINMICLNPKCFTQRLLCNQCFVDKHADHSDYIKTYKSFLEEVDKEISTPKGEKEKNQEEEMLTDLNDLQEKIKETIKANRNVVEGFTNNFLHEFEKVINSRLSMNQRDAKIDLMILKRSLETTNIDDTINNILMQVQYDPRSKSFKKNSQSSIKSYFKCVKSVNQRAEELMENFHEQVKHLNDSMALFFRNGSAYEFSREMKHSTVKVSEDGLKAKCIGSGRPLVFIDTNLLHDDTVTLKFRVLSITVYVGIGVGDPNTVKHAGYIDPNWCGYGRYFYFNDGSTTRFEQPSNFVYGVRTYRQGDLISVQYDTSSSKVSFKANDDDIGSYKIAEKLNEICPIVMLEGEGTEVELVQS